MGHANIENLSKIFLRQIHTWGKFSIREVTDFLISRRQFLDTIQGQIDDPGMIACVMEEIVSFWIKPHELSRRKISGAVGTSPIIEAVNLTPEQYRIFTIWCEELNIKWKAGPDGRSGEYGVFDSIKWRLTSKWRQRYPDIPLLTRYEN